MISVPVANTSRGPKTVSVPTPAFYKLKGSEKVFTVPRAQTTTIQIAPGPQVSDLLKDCFFFFEFCMQKRLYMAYYLSYFQQLSNRIVLRVLILLRIVLRMLLNICQAILMKQNLENYV